VNLVSSLVGSLVGWFGFGNTEGVARTVRDALGFLRYCNSTSEPGN